MLEDLILKMTETKTEFEEGEVLLEEGEQSGHLYILLDGTVEIVVDDVQIATISDAGAPLGEMAFLLNGPHRATVRALTHVSALDVEDPQQLTSENPNALLYIASTLAARLAETSEIVAELHKHYYEVLEEHVEPEKHEHITDRVKHLWDRFGEIMRTKIADF